MSDDLEWREWVQTQVKSAFGRVFLVEKVKEAYLIALIVEILTTERSLLAKYLEPSEET